MTLRLRLILLTFAVLAPAAVASVLGVVWIYDREGESFRQRLQETSRALALVVDRELVAREAILETLTTSSSLVLGDLNRFQRQMDTLSESLGGILSLRDAEGRILLTAPQSLGLESDAPVEGIGGGVGDPTYATAPLPWAQPVAQIKDTLISDLEDRPERGGHGFAVRRAVWSEGRPIYWVTLWSSAGQLQSVFADQRLPDGWAGAVLDRTGRVAARNLHPEDTVGKMATADVVRRMKANSKDGSFDSVTLDGIASVAALSRAPASGWAFIIGVPQTEVAKRAREAVLVVVAASLLLFALAAVLAVWLGRSIQRPILQLAEAAAALGRGEAPETPMRGVSEVDAVSAALTRAGADIRDARADMERRVAEAVDASERSQRALLQSQKLEALGRLTGGIAHDFNNLLQTLSTGIELAGESTNEPDAKGALAACQRALGRAVRLTRQLMAFGRNQVSEARSLDLRTQLLAMEDLFSSALRRGIQLRLELAPDLWPVRVDPVQFEMAILNLIFNARDAMPEKGTVTVKAENLLAPPAKGTDLAPGEYVRLIVSDTGYGMTADVVARALEPFFTTKEVGKGSGLGLPQVYGFVRQSGGDLSLDSEPGKGTAVTLCLPRCKDLPATAAAESPPEPVAAGRKATVLVVEDDVLVREVVAPALRGYGFRVLVAPNADEALEIFEDRSDIEAVFSDIVMPGRINGLELAAEIRKRRPGLPVILATGYSKHSLDAHPGVRVITKPYDVAALARLLREALPE